MYKAEAIFFITLPEAYAALASADLLTTPAEAAHLFAEARLEHHHLAHLATHKQ